MHRLAATVRLDLRLQWRNGFYYVVAFVLACWFVLLTRLPAIDWGYVLPAVVFGNLVMVNFYFIAGPRAPREGRGDAGSPGGDAARRLGVPRLEDGDADRALARRAGRHRVVGPRRRLRGRSPRRRHRAGGGPLHPGRLSPHRALPVDQRVHVPLDPLHRGPLPADAALLRPLGTPGCSISIPSRRPSCCWRGPSGRFRRGSGPTACSTPPRGPGCFSLAARRTFDRFIVAREGGG